MKYCLDANIFITAWEENHPFDIFPGLWPQLAESKDKVVLIKPIFDEIELCNSNDRKKLTPAEPKEKYPLRNWLEENQFEATKTDKGQINETALTLEIIYETKDKGKGASKNDIMLIAYAKEEDNTVVTMESPQSQKPAKLSNYKIPLICGEQGVECIRFIDLLRELEIQVP